MAYYPPGVTTETTYENPLSAVLESLKIPVLVGEGNETLYQQDLEVVRGSSSATDQRVAGEDVSSRMVVSQTAAGDVTLGDPNGSLDTFQVLNRPIVTGNGTGTTTNSRTDVAVTINGSPIVVRGVDGARGLVQLATVVNDGDVVLCTYFYNRSDTLVTDDVSAQVPNRAATVKSLTGVADVNAPNSTSEVLYLHGDLVSLDGTVTALANNVLNLKIDGVDRTIVLPTRTDYTMAQVAAAITAARAGTLTAASFVNSAGHSALMLQSDHSLAVKEGSANSPLGILTGTADNRVSTFYVFNGPMVDGTGGGVVTTDPASVVVKVNGRQFIPTSVEGNARAVTITPSPIAGARVTVQYWWNTWQDTFDNLYNIGVTAVTQCGSVPGANDYTQGADFVLHNNRIMWGTAAQVEAGLNTVGSEPFSETQVSFTLIDDRTFLSPLTPVTATSGGITTDSRLYFQLPENPTLGNGRDTPLGQSLFQTVSNGRIDVPVNRPDVVWAYWGFDLQDAVARGRVEVLKVDGSVITLKDPVPVGAQVFGTFYYNRLTDESYTLSCLVPGASNVGQYTMQDSGGNDIFTPVMVSGGKGTALTGVTVEFPSGSEMTPDLRYESGSGTYFTGPAEEIVTVQFAARKASPAKFSLSGAGPFTFIPNQSSFLRLQLHAVDVFGATGLNLMSPSKVATHVGGYFASLVGDELSYAGGAGATVGQNVTLTATETLTLTVDGVDIPVSLPPAAAVDATYFAARINDNASGHMGLCQAGSADATLVMNAAATPTNAATSDDYYLGWKVVLGTSALPGAAAGGQVRTILSYDGASRTATIDADWDGGPATPPVALQPYFVYNPSTMAIYTGAARFNGPVTLGAGLHDKLRLVYTGDVSGALSLTGANQVDLGDGPFATAALLADEVTLGIRTQITALASAPHAGLEITCTANAEGQLVFKVQLPGVDNAGIVQFLTAATPAQDFAVLAGLDAASAVALGQAALVQGPIARAYECPATGEAKPFDRVILRNRLLPGGGGSMAADFVVSKTGLSVKVGNSVLGLATGASGVAGSAAVVHPATLTGASGLLGGQSGTTAQPTVTFYDGTGSIGANNVFTFDIDGDSVTTTFTASAGGTVTPIGLTTVAGSVLAQIADAMAAYTGAPWGNAATVIAAGLVRQEGAGIRLTGALTSAPARLTIGSGTANSVLGFATGQTSLRSLTSVAQLASALMSNQHDTFVNWVLSPSNFAATSFATYGLASVETDLTGAEFLYVQDAPTLTAGLGTVSSVLVKNPSPNVKSALFYGTGLTALDADGATGDPALNGFFVSSSSPTGSGSVNTSVLNNGSGQDGIVGQTYRDEVTGLTFTVLPRGWSTDKNGPWVSYPTGSNATFRVRGSRTMTCASLPINPIPGLELRVTNTVGVGIEDTAIVTTFERSGNEPAIGESYYSSYVYTKQDYETKFFTKISDVEREYGVSHPDNPVSLAANIMMKNGALLVGIKQVPRAAGSTQADLVTYRTAIEELENVLPGNVTPDIIVPLRGDSLELFQIIKRSCDKMSSLRYKSERTSIFGVSAGTLPKDAILIARNMSNKRMRMVYPDMALVTIQDGQGNTKEHLVDGPFMAAALAGSVVSPNVDVATPWTGRLLSGFTQLARKLNAVDMNQMAQNGITILEDRPPFLRVRHGLTTDMSDTLTKLPTIAMIQDEVQRQTRQLLDNFVGQKFLPGVLSQIEGRLAMLMKRLVAANIIVAYTGIKARVSTSDPTAAEVEAFFSPVLPLLYINVKFHLRSSL